MKKIYTALIFSAVVSNAFAAWNGVQSSSWTKGDGTEGNPYIIENEEQFAFFQRSVSDGESYDGKYFRLSADLDMGGHSMYPIGLHDDYMLDGTEYKESKFFLGTFDGGFKTIDNLKIIKPVMEVDLGGIGVFAGGREATTIKNFIVGQNVTVDGSGSIDVGGVMGIAYGSIIENCKYAGVVVGGSTESGGIVGGAYENTEIRACIFSGSLDSYSFSGGIVGDTEKAMVTDCLFSGTVNGGQAYYIAGIVSWALNSSVSNCLSIGKINGQIGSSWMPGVSPVCADLEKSTASNCYYVAELTGCDPLSPQTGVISKTKEEASSAEMVKLLNSGADEGLWISGTDGMPTLAWTVSGFSALDEISVNDVAEAYVAGGEITVMADNADMTISDIYGRVLYAGRVSGSAVYVPSSKGIYIVLVHDAAGRKSVFKLGV